jgi:GTPase
MATPLVAIIGFPNSGKSTLFNKILEQRKALTYPTAGTTRDRAYGLTSWNGLDFYLIDTAGILLNPDSDLEKNIQKQTAIAREEADLILLIADGKTNPDSKDIDVAKQLKRSGKPVILAVNKIDTRNTKTETAASQFQKIGLGAPFLVSSVNGAGIGDLLDQIVVKLKEKFTESRVDYSDRLKITFVGRPNVGKSSLINALLKQERLLVHDQPGTTRSTVEIPFDHKGQKFLLLDTAGIKKKWKQDIDVEAAAAMQSIRTLNQTDVALFVLDANGSLSFQDQVIAQKILEENKNVVVLLNKSDLISESDQQKLLDILPDYFPQIWWAPVVFTSAKTSLGLNLALQFATEIFNRSKTEIDQDNLDRFLDKILEEHMPGKMEDQRSPKIYNLKQLSVTPPVFKLTVNFPAAIATSWKRFMEKQFRLKFGFEGVPIVIKYIKRI